MRNSTHKSRKLYTWYFKTTKLLRTCGRRYEGALYISIRETQEGRFEKKAGGIQEKI